MDFLSLAADRTRCHRCQLQQCEAEMKGKLMEKAFRANIHGITPDCYLWTNPIPERIVHYSKQRDPKQTAWAPCAAALRETDPRRRSKGSSGMDR
ncbi:unnamed protein product [Gadus morhua 'NCC']